MITERNGKLIVKTPYNRAFADGMKFLHSKWDPDEKCWIAEPGRREEIESLIARTFPEKQEDNPQTMKAIVDRLIAEPSILYEGDSVDRLILFSFYYGLEKGVHTTSDQYKDLIRSMRKRATKSRYKALINEVIGDKDYIVLPEYPQRITKELGDMETNYGVKQP